MWDRPGELDWEVEQSSMDDLADSLDSVLLKKDLSRTRSSPRKLLGTRAGEVRLARVLRLRSAIAAGTYQVSLEELAEKMLVRAQCQRAVTKGMYSV